MTLKISSTNKYSCKITAKILKKGGIAIVPTDTVYSFIIDVFNIEAQKTLYKIKMRSLKKPFILMVHNIDTAKLFVKISYKILNIVNKFWPGQLTLILPVTTLGKIISGGRKNLGVRIPDNDFLINLLKEINGPAFTTSVNITTKKSAKNINDAMNFYDIVDVIVDGGKCRFSFESTIIDMSHFPYTIVRKGCLNVDDLSNLNNI
ncbi:MAG: threonylcarbamoyl-AMP synthase [Endomicrobium sp.]|jgi:L-threonylcarbamoyladenylate synthase|nr:threonylcarbamoyl-AMP synthase [Endomicrobium sp.]